MIITLSDEIVSRCKKFAEDRLTLSANLYKWRGETKQDKMVEDIVIGTMGEFGVYSYLCSKGIVVSEPDLTIYSQRNKKHGADLIGEKHRINIKSQSASSVKRYNHSWLFQRTDKLVSVPSDIDFCAFTAVDGVLNQVEIVAVVRAKDLIPYYAECKVPMYRHSKVALYLKDFQSEIDLQVL